MYIRLRDNWPLDLQGTPVTGTRDWHTHMAMDSCMVAPLQNLTNLNWTPLKTTQLVELYLLI